MFTPLQEVTRSWFSSLFCTALPAETSVRIWDVLFLEGPKILFRAALALFKVCALLLTWLWDLTLSACSA